MHNSWKICHALTTVLVWDVCHPALAQAATNSLSVSAPSTQVVSAYVIDTEVVPSAASKVMTIAPPESVMLPESGSALAAIPASATESATDMSLPSPPLQTIAQNIDTPPTDAPPTDTPHTDHPTALLLPSTELELSLSKPWPGDAVPTIDGPDSAAQALPAVPAMAMPVSLAPAVKVAVPTIVASTPPTVSESTPASTIQSNASGLKLESLTTNFQNESDGIRTNRIIEPTAHLKLPNGDRLQVKSGWNTFQQSGIDTVQNWPLQGAWVKKLGDNKLKLGGGVDLFNRLPIQPKLNAELEVPLGVEISPEGKLNRGVVVKGLLDYGAYKFNAKTLERGINVLHAKPEVYWQIDPKTSFYSHYQLGLYNDGNVEHQTYSRLERKIGKFFVAANLFTWNYKADQEANNGYFSPQQFLTYNGEVGWAGDVAKGLSCRVTAALGQQTLNGNNSNISQYNGRCTAAIAPNIALDFGYGFSNEKKQNLNANNYQNHSVTGQLRMTF